MTKVRRAIAAMLATLVLVAPIETRAQAPDDPKAAAAEAATRAQAHFAREEWELAVEDLVEAYALDPDPAYLYARAQAERMAGHCKIAIALYERFLESDPSAAQAEDTRINIRRCEETLWAEQAAEPQPQPKSTDAPTEPSTTEPDPAASSPTDDTDARALGNATRRARSCCPGRRQLRRGRDGLGVRCAWPSRRPRCRDRGRLREPGRPGTDDHRRRDRSRGSRSRARSRCRAPLRPARPSSPRRLHPPATKPSSRPHSPRTPSACRRDSASEAGRRTRRWRRPGRRSMTRERDDAPLAAGCIARPRYRRGCVPGPDRGN